MRSFVFISCLGIFLSGCTSSKKFFLPYSSQQDSKLIQGWNGKYGHVEHVAYAYDFLMPIGTPVLASHKGTVISVEQSFEDNTKTPGKENFVIIDNGNNTFSRYYHLTKNGVRVKVGERVKVKDTIGFSGNSGASGGPHLHFDVTKDCYNWGCQTIQFEFKNAIENPLQAGKTYSPK